MVTCAVVCLFLLQSLAFLVSGGAGASAADDRHASLAAPGEICFSATQSGKAPAPAAQHPHCLLCILHKADAGAALVALLLQSAVLAGLFRSFDSLPIWERVDAERFPSGWGSSWSSRAPPVSLLTD